MSVKYRYRKQNKIARLAVSFIKFLLFSGAIGLAYFHGLPSMPQISQIPIPAIFPTLPSLPTLGVPATSNDTAGLPNRASTPGAIDPRVTQANIYSTICRKGGYTSSVRPPVSYTEPLKIKQIAQYGYSDKRLSHYEEDHLIPLEVGGNPADPKNLWPEPRAGIWGASKKDSLENKLHDLVCSGRLDLATAQKAIAADWIAAYKKYVGAG
ncbi:MAG: hypothetical protein HYR70_04480 [Chloroflexi bacterium]|nr:hypothetical protein [Chloroflexota bacterium]MBI3340813.1 hypothetical protein [Chloroflexota bacterium]